MTLPRLNNETRQQIEFAIEFAEPGDQPSAGALEILLQVHDRAHELLPALNDPIADVVGDVVEERRRQIAVEGWTPEHDDDHPDGALARAAACYAAGKTFEENYARWTRADGPKPNPPHRLWPWGMEWWKPKDRRTDLVRAAALIVAEIERLDRAAAS